MAISLNSSVYTPLTEVQYFTCLFLSSKIYKKYDFNRKLMFPSSDPANLDQHSLKIQKKFFKKEKKEWDLVLKFDLFFPSCTTLGSSHQLPWYELFL